MPGCDFKQRYHLVEHALNHLARYPGDKRLHIYFCDQHQCLHVGHYPKGFNPRLPESGRIYRYATWDDAFQGAYHRQLTQHPPLKAYVRHSPEPLNPNSRHKPWTVVFGEPIEPSVKTPVEGAVDINQARKTLRARFRL